MLGQDTHYDLQQRVVALEKEKSELQAKLSAAASDAANIEKERRVRALPSHTALVIGEAVLELCGGWSSSGRGLHACVLLQQQQQVRPCCLDEQQATTLYKPEHVTVCNVL